MSRGQEERKVSVAEARSLFDSFGDHNLAAQLQQDEFSQHYNLNRQERQQVGVDTRVSKVEQLGEIRNAYERVRAANQSIAESDEEIARRLQAEFEAEEAAEHARKLELEQRDAALAAALQDRLSGASSSGRPDFLPTQPSAVSARRRSSESMQNDLNHLVATTRAAAVAAARSASLIEVDDSSPVRPSALSSPLSPFPLSSASSRPLQSSAVPPSPARLPPPEPCSVSSPLPSSSPQAEVLSPPLLLPSNPFLADLIKPPGTPTTASPSQPHYQQAAFTSEFGLPPSQLALGTRRH